MQHDTAQTNINGLIEAKDFPALKRVLAEIEVHALAGVLAELSGEDRAVAFRLLGPDKAAEELALLEHEQQEDLLTTLSGEKLSAILQEMSPDDRTELLEEMPGEMAQRLLANLRGEERKIAQRLLAYPEDSVGRLMTPEYVALRPDWTVQQVFEHIRKVGREMETLNVNYVVDDRGKLLDEVRLEQLVLAEPEAVVSDLMDRQAPFLYARDDQEAAVELLRKYDAVALPVVDRNGVLVGIVTHDDVMDVAQEEITEDMQIMAGMAALEHSYFATDTLGMLRKRLPWLALLLGAQLLTTVALSQFYTLPLFAVLVIFMPLINSPAGNTGSQMAGLMIRSLAVAEMQVGDWWRVLRREAARGLMLGLLLAALGFAAALAFATMVAPEQYRPVQIAVSVAVAMGLMVALANIVGAMLPFFFKRVGLDPAVTSGPFIASLMDITGILVYFAIGMTVLHATG